MARASDRRRARPQTAETGDGVCAWLYLRRVEDYRAAWRAQAKEAAALDYIADGAWRDPREDVRKDRAAGEARMETGETRPPANDNALIRIAGEIRHAALGWRHGAAVDAFAAERGEVMTAWEELRDADPSRRGCRGAQPGLSARPSTATRRCSSRPRPSVPGRGPSTDCSPSVPASAGRISTPSRRFMTAPARTGAPLPSRTVQARRMEAAPEQERTVAPVTAEAAAQAVTRSTEANAAPKPVDTAAPDWRALYDALQQDWNGMIDRSTQPDLPLLLEEGYAALFRRVRDLAEHTEVAETERKTCLWN